MRQLGLQLRAILGDSFREAIERRLLLVLLALATVVIVFCFGISFSGKSAGAVLHEQAQGLHRFHQQSAFSSSGVQEWSDVVFDVAEPREVAASDDLPEALGDGLVVELEFAGDADVDRLARHWERFQQSPFRRGEDDPPEAAPPLGVEQRRAFFEQRFAAFGYSAVHAQPLGGARWRVAVRTDYPDEVVGAHEMHVLFGFWTVPLSETSVAETVVAMQLGLAGVFAGQIGMFIAILVCAGFVPSMLQKGTLDLTLARPIGRARLLLAKYVGGLWFVFVLAAYLVLGCWLGFSVGAGYSNPWYLAIIATITLQFAVLYAVTVLVGVAARSGGLAALVTLGVWMFSGAIVSGRHALDQIGVEVPETVRTAVETAYTVLPKTGDIALLNNLILARSHLSPEAFARIPALAIPDVDWAFSLGTTAAFAAVMLALACWIFRRRDY